MPDGLVADEPGTVQENPGVNVLVAATGFDATDHGTGHPCYTITGHAGMTFWTAGRPATRRECLAALGEQHPLVAAGVLAEFRHQAAGRTIDHAMLDLIAAVKARELIQRAARVVAAELPAGTPPAGRL